MENNRYFLYARKSTEWEDRQVQSLDDQVRIMQSKAESMWLKVVDTFIESKSAKAPGRPRFNEMISKINDKEAVGIIAWKLDRLSRNPIDSATIQYMLQNWSLDKIITNDKEYTVYDSGLLMSVENGMSNQYILDLKKAVRRWQNTKYEKGIRPSLVPIWYLNNIIERDIISDEDRFKIVRQMWDLMLTWNYSIRKTITKANEEWWLRTVKKRKSGWGPLSKSSWERIFRNIFYTWYFYYNWELIKWAHEPMISLEEYDRVQRLLWKKWKPRPKHREFSYTGMITCWICWCMVTAETKNKYIKSTAETKEYTYYHCTKKKKDIACTEKCITVEKLEDQISMILESIEIDVDFKKWVFDAIRENYNSEFEARDKMYQSIVSSITSEERKLKVLLNKLLKEMIDDDTYNENKNEIQNTITTLKKKRDSIDLKGQQTLETTEQIFDFTFNLSDSFSGWSIQRKKEMFSAIGKNFILKDWVLWLELEPWYKVIQTEYPKLVSELEGLEPTKKDTSTDLTDVFSLKKFKWWNMNNW